MAQEIRTLTIDDYDEIIRVWSDSGLEHKPQGRDRRELMAAEMDRPFCAFIGLFEDDRMIGLGIANWDGRRGWINRVAVDPDYRGKRLAGKIIKACEDFLYEQGALVICTLIHEFNEPSMACFENQGYRCEGEIKYFTKRNSPLD